MAEVQRGPVSDVLRSILIILVNWIYTFKDHRTMCVCVFLEVMAVETLHF